jgi:intracellular septation protein
MNKTSILALIAEFGPLVAFFIAGQLYDFFTAVSILMATTVLAVTVSWVLDRRIPWLPIISAIIVLIGGAITLIFKIPDAIILADTIYYGLVAVAIGSSLRYRKNFIEMLFGTIFALTPQGWRILAIRWCIFLIIAAIANEIARHFLTPDAWVTYRLIKSIAITLFAVAQFGLATHYRIPELSNRWGIRTHHH